MCALTGADQLVVRAPDQASLWGLFRPGVFCKRIAAGCGSLLGDQESQASWPSLLLPPSRWDASLLGRQAAAGSLRERGVSVAKKAGADALSPSAFGNDLTSACYWFRGNESEGFLWIAGCCWWWHALCDSACFAWPALELLYVSPGFRR